MRNFLISTGVGTQAGIHCGYLNSAAIDNVITGFSTAVDICTDGGNHVY